MSGILEEHPVITKRGMSRESEIFSKKNVRQMQDYKKTWRLEDHLRKS